MLTSLKKKGVHWKRLSDKQRKFTLEYLVNHNATEAARAAGYKQPSVKGSQLLKHPLINRLVGKLENDDVDRLELDRHEALKQLYYALTRRIADFCDENGIPLHPSKLPEQCQSIVDGYKAKVLWTEEDGTQLQEIEYKITPHATARDQAMKHKGLFAAEQQVVKHQIDWDEMYEQPNGDTDAIEQKILDVESDDA